MSACDKRHKSKMTHPSRSRCEKSDTICCSLCPPQQNLTSICNRPSWPVQRETGYLTTDVKYVFTHSFLVACSWRHFFTCFFTCLFLLFIYFLCCSLRLFYVWAGIFFFPMTCSAAHWDNNNICERKERNECMSKHTQGKTCWQVFHCGCHMTGGNSCITLRSTEQQQPWHLQ